MDEDKSNHEFTFHQLPKSRKTLKKSELKSNIIPAHIKCPKCGFKGIVSDQKKDFNVLEKDEEGYLYFACPKCQSHLKYNGLIGEITIAKAKH